jgi:hypothetical protein
MVELLLISSKKTVIGDIELKEVLTLTTVKPVPLGQDSGIGVRFNCAPEEANCAKPAIPGEMSLAILSILLSLVVELSPSEKRPRDIASAISNDVLDKLIRTYRYLPKSTTEKRTPMTTGKTIANSTIAEPFSILRPMNRTDISSGIY